MSRDVRVKTIAWSKLPNSTNNTTTTHPLDAHSHPLDNTPQCCYNLQHIPIDPSLNSQEMPRPQRTKVASKGARVVTSPIKVPTSTSSIPSKADSMAPAKKKPRGRPPKFKAAEAAEEIESSGDKVQKKAKGRPAAKRKTTRAVETEVEDEQPSALEILKKRMSGGKKAEARSVAVVVDERLYSLSPSADEEVEVRRTSPGKATQAARSRVTSTPMPRQSSILRGRTPSVMANTDDDLYGLSPAGKAAQERLNARRTSMQQAPPSALKVHGTPGMETSILALANFKRRARQPSMIRMMQQTSELGHKETDLELLLDETLRDFEDFMPEDESTPLNFGRKTRNAENDDQRDQSDGLRTSSSRKRKHADVEDDVQVPGSFSVVASSPPRGRRSDTARSNRSSSLPEERVIPSTEDQDSVNADPLSQSDTVVPPRSSSAPASPNRQKTRGKAITRTAEPQNLKKPTKKAPKISTAHLQSLLPKARAKPGARAVKKKATGVYDVPSDDEELEVDTTFDLPEDDDDELSRPAAGKRRGTSIRPSKTPLRKADTNKKLRKKIASPDKALVSAATKAKLKRTYGRQKSAEQENDKSGEVGAEDEDETEVGDSGMTKTKPGKSSELERLKKMFAQVDEFEMEFESVDMGGGDSSPWR